MRNSHRLAAVTAVGLMLAAVTAGCGSSAADADRDSVTSQPTQTWSCPATPTDQNWTHSAQQPAGALVAANPTSAERCEYTFTFNQQPRLVRPMHHYTGANLLNLVRTINDAPRVTGGQGCPAPLPDSVSTVYKFRFEYSTGDAVVVDWNVQCPKLITNGKLRAQAPSQVPQ